MGLINGRPDSVDTVFNSENIGQEMTAKTFRPDVQGLRGIAVFAVVVYHLGLFLPGGFLGVDVFFVISGFVIAQIVVNECDSRGTVRWGNFFARRAARLVPALAIVVSVTVAVAVLVFTSPALQENALATGVAAVFGVSNVVIADLSGGYFGFAPSINPLVHTWSLSVEWQFYLFFPLILILGEFAERRGFFAKEKVLLIGVIALSTMSFLLSFGEANAPILGQLDVFGFYSPIPRFWEFGLGVLALLTVRAMGPIARGRALWLSLGGLALLVAALFVVGEDTRTPGPTTLLPTVATALLIVAGTSSATDRNFVDRVLASRPLTWLGDVSYSLYLWHWPVLYFAKELGFPNNPQRMLFVVVVSLLLSVLSYSLVEKKFRYRQQAAPRNNLARLGMLAVAPLLMGALWPVVGADYRDALRARGVISVISGDLGQNTFYRTVEAQFFPCDPVSIRDKAEAWEGSPRCHQSQESGEVTVALVGDSYAEHLFPGLAPALPEENVAYYIRSSELAVPSSSPEMAEILDHVYQSSSIHTVIFSNEWMSSGVPVEELSTTVLNLRESGKHVVLTNGSPKAPFPPDNCKVSPYIYGPRVCDFPLEPIDVSQDVVQKDLEKVARTVPSTVLLDTLGLFCQEGFCSIENETLGLLYRDDKHLNLLGSKVAGEYISSALHSAGR
jgi:peptidoglycan/LPS O-acetylase OafA/YrhL